MKRVLSHRISCEGMRRANMQLCRRVSAGGGAPQPMEAAGGAAMARGGENTGRGKTSLRKVKADFLKGPCK